MCSQQVSQHSCIVYTSEGVFLHHIHHGRWMVWSSWGNTSTLASGEIPHQKLLVLQNGQRQTASDIPRDYNSRSDIASAAALFLDGPGVFGHYTGHHTIYYYIPGLRFYCLSLSGILSFIICYSSCSYLPGQNFDQVLQGLGSYVITFLLLFAQNVSPVHL